MKLIILLSILLISCEKKNDHANFSRQRFVPRPGYDHHLTNRVCRSNKLGSCKEWSIRAYDLRDDLVRKQYVDFKIACRIAGRRFRVCLDKPGFCRRERVCKKKSGFFKKKCKKWDKKIEYIPISNYQYLIDSNLECFWRLL